LTSQTQGVDRHNFGLSMIAHEKSQPLSDLFLDPLHLRAKEWRVSTRSTFKIMRDMGRIL
jgi:Choline/Carnitine o-acyltransferase